MWFLVAALTFFVACNADERPEFIFKKLRTLIAVFWSIVVQFPKIRYSCHSSFLTLHYYGTWRSFFTFFLSSLHFIFKISFSFDVKGRDFFGKLYWSSGEAGYSLSTNSMVYQFSGDSENIKI